MKALEYLQKMRNMDKEVVGIINYPLLAAIAELEEFEKMYLTRKPICSGCEYEASDSQLCNLCSRRYYDKFKISDKAK